MSFMVSLPISKIIDTYRQQSTENIQKHTVNQQKTYVRTPLARPRRKQIFSQVQKSHKLAIETPFQNSFFDDDDNKQQQQKDKTMAATTTSSKCKKIINPYAKSSSSSGSTNAAAAASAAAAAANEDDSTTTTKTNNNKNNNSSTATMGKQSQFRNGAVKNAMKRATKAGKTKAKKFAAQQKNRVQRSMSGGVGFVPHLHCMMCVANDKVKKGLIATAPHRRHDPRCWAVKRKFAGLSDHTRMVEREAAKNIELNNRPLVPVVDRPTYQPGRVLFPLFDATTTTTTNTTTTATTTNTNTTATTTENGTSESSSLVVTKNVASVDSIKAAVDERMSTSKIYVKSKCPRQVGAAINYLMDTIAHTKKSSTVKPLPTTEKFAKAFPLYRQFFKPGCCDFTFPPADAFETANPNYHVLEGQSIIYLDWKMMFPKMGLLCPVCRLTGDHCPLSTEKHTTNLSNDKTLFPIWGNAGLPTWAVVVRYKCVSCDCRLLANDGRLLNSLPAHIRKAYPVNPRYATGLFHLHEELTFDLELLMRTYANARFVSNKLFRKMGQQYTTAVSTYLSKIATADFPSIENWSGNVMPPSDKSIRELFHAAENSPLNIYGYSNKARARREIQSVEVKAGDKMAVDWTFATLTNYHQLKSAKAIFTANKGSTKEIVLVALVPSTKVSDASHALQQARSRRGEGNFDPGALYTDTCPHNTDYYKRIFGLRLNHRLGLFHLAHRMIETYDVRSELYWDAIVDTQEAIYTYRATEYDALIKALQDGSFSSSSKHYTAEEINDVRHSKYWNQRYQEYLPKLTNPPHIQQFKLRSIILKYKNKLDSKGMSVFTPRSEKAILEQCKKVHHSNDPDDIDMYTEIAPTKNSKHGLSKWMSNRPEPALEKYHEILQHFANTGTNSELADTLNFEGTAEWNIKCRWKQLMNQENLEGITRLIPVHFEDQPRFWDHSLLQTLNIQAASKGMKPLFNFVTKCKPDNGEEFLSAYHRQQIVRNRQKKTNPKTKLCTCLDCKAPTIAVAPNLPPDNPPLSPPKRNLKPPPPAIAQIQNVRKRRGEDATTSNSAPRANTSVAQVLPVMVPPPPPPLRAAMARSPLSVAAVTPDKRNFGYCCITFENYVADKRRGVRRPGRPPHHSTCGGNMLPPPQHPTYMPTQYDYMYNQPRFGLGYWM
jgi:hypothetical protein